MKFLSKDLLMRVVREFDSTPALRRWLLDSRDELHEQLSGCSEKEFKHLQGQLSTINQILDKDLGKD